jgi:phosphoribosylaminoimidazolecarboxamide formyltransferase/IMP cyclohydrolase
MSSPVRIRRALISVYDKTGVVEFGRALHDEFGVEIISTGGTAKVLTDAGVPVTLIETITGSPELLDGRVKTLHPRIFAAILADRDKPEHMRQLAEHGIDPIDMVVVNLYPFEKTVADPNCAFEQAMEMIDVGGVALLRAAGKNRRHVLSIHDPGEYEPILALLRKGLVAIPGPPIHETAFVGFGAFAVTSQYDAAIAAWLGKAAGSWPQPHVRWLMDWGPVRYGENPQQQAHLVGDSSGGGLMNLVYASAPQADLESFRDLQGRLSYNNYLDADAALGLCAELTRARNSLPGLTSREGPSSAAPRPPVAGATQHFDAAPQASEAPQHFGTAPQASGAQRSSGAGHPIAATAERCRACVFVKHTNPCGVGVGLAMDASDSARITTRIDAEAVAAQIEAYGKAYLSDPNAAMGGVLACNFPITAEFAAMVMETYDRFGKPLREAAARASGSGAPPGAAPGGFFVEVWIAPEFSDEAVSIIRGTAGPTRELPNPPRKKWGESVRLLAVGDMSRPLTEDERVYRSIAGGMLAQTPDRVGLEDEPHWRVVTKRAPSERELADLRLAWLVCKHTKSNAVSIVRDGMLIGNGAGQMSRVMSCRVATWLARENGHLGDRPPAGLLPEAHRPTVRSAPVAASDAFFPFRDGVDVLLDAGVRAIIQPGGSKRDAEVIATCDERGAAMIFTGVRHFRH